MQWKDNEKGFDALIRRLKALEAKQVDVGFFNTKYNQDNDNLSVAQVAQWQEEGTQTAPSRPFIRTGFNSEVMSKYKAPINKMLCSVAEGKLTPHAACKKLGEGLKIEMQAAILDGDRYQANSEKWAAFKEATTGSSTPLTYTGKMHDSVKFRVILKR